MPSAPNKPRRPFGAATVFSNLSIGFRVGLLTGLAVLAFAVLGGVYWLGKTNVDTAVAQQKTFEKLFSGVSKIEVDLQRMRITERDFLAERKPEAAAAYKESLSNVQTALEGLSVGESGWAFDIKESLFATTQALSKQFSTVEKTRRTLGLTPDEGLWGKLIASTKAVENELKQWPNVDKLKGKLETMRKHELSFMLDKNPNALNFHRKAFGEFDFGLYEVSLDNDTVKLLTKLATQYRNDLKAYADAILALESQVATLDQSFKSTLPLFNQLKTLARDNMAEAAALQETTRGQTATLLAIAAAIALTIYLVLATVLNRSITAPVKRIEAAARAVAGGDSDIEISDTGGKDEIGAMARALDTLKDVSVESMKIKSALDDASVSMTMTDPLGVIVYANTSARTLFETHEATVASVLDGCTAKNLDGMTLDRLFGAAENGAAKAVDLVHGFTTKATIGGATFQVTGSPVANRNGEHLGAAIEWRDMTQELALQEEVARSVEAAAQGDFSGRIELAGVSGFMERMGGGINHLLDAVDAGLADVIQVMDALSKGQLDARMTGHHQGAFLKLKEDSNRMAETLNQTVIGINRSSDIIGNASAEVANGMDALAQRTVNQAARLEETAAAMEEISENVNNNAANALNVDQRSRSALGQAQSGRDVADKAVSAINRVEASSKEIAGFIDTIDGIAFQTNLLALNAAVEAARAGDAGAGFSVVAAEVRSLAAESAEAARQIKELVGRNSNEIASGVSLVRKTGEALQEISASIDAVCLSAAEIAAASQQQADTVAQVSESVTEMDESTQRNSALVEEFHAASSSLKEQADQLLELVGFFTVDENSTPAAFAADWTEALEGGAYAIN